MSTLQFSDYEFEKYGYMKAPQPKLNGGLYSGEAFNGAHGNISVIADGEYMNTQNLKSANGPIEGLFHYPGYTRPGNNKQELPGTKQYSNIHSFRCLSNKHLIKHKNKNFNGLNGTNVTNGTSVSPNNIEKFTNTSLCLFSCGDDSKYCPCHNDDKEHPCYGATPENLDSRTQCKNNLFNYCCNENPDDEMCKALKKSSKDVRSICKKLNKS